MLPTPCVTCSVLVGKKDDDLRWPIFGRFVAGDGLHHHVKRCSRRSLTGNTARLTRSDHVDETKLTKIASLAMVAEQDLNMKSDVVRRGGPRVSDLDIKTTVFESPPN